MNQFFAQKVKFPNLDWTFYVIWNYLLLTKRESIKFDWIVNSLILRNLLINYLNLIKESIQEQLPTEKMFFEIGVLKNFAIFRRKHLLEPDFDKVAGLQVSCEHWEFFKDSNFYKITPATAQENISGQGVIDLSF